ncbi:MULTISPECIES: TolC family protein [unclassified Moraxella]|uniref:TolC family protein n=1 Tax=unclassified Moraxella TaxID=2685852 RepID=UPI003AF95B10
MPLSLVTTVGHTTNLIDINGLISQAVQTHPLVGSAIAEEQATQEGVKAARLGVFPVPSITSGYDKNDGLISRANIRQPLWTGGKLTAAVNQAMYDDKAATAYIYEQQNTVAKNTIDIWQSYIYATALQGLYVNNLKQLDEFEAMMKRRVEQGVSARIDLDLVTNRILQDQNAYQGAVQQQRIAEARLAQMIGESINPQDKSPAPLNQLAKYVKSQSKDFERMAFSDAGINNPKVIKQQFQIEAAKQQVKAQQSARYPTIYAQYENLYYHKRNDNEGQFSFGLSYEPGAGFSTAAIARASQARVAGLEQSQEVARRAVMEDIQTQYQQFVSAKDQETSLIAAVAGAQIVVDSYRRQFIAGRKTWLEVLNAVREKAGYQQQLLQVQSQMIGAFYKLQVDFGRMGWQNYQPLTEPTAEYHPYSEFQGWLKDYNLPTFNLNHLNLNPNSVEPSTSVQDSTSQNVIEQNNIAPSSVEQNNIEQNNIEQSNIEKNTEKTNVPQNNSEPNNSEQSSQQKVEQINIDPSPIEKNNHNEQTGIDLNPTITTAVAPTPENKLENNAVKESIPVGTNVSPVISSTTDTPANVTVANTKEPVMTVATIKKLEIVETKTH